MGKERKREREEIEREEGRRQGGGEQEWGEREGQSNQDTKVVTLQRGQVPEAGKELFVGLWRCGCWWSRKKNCLLSSLTEKAAEHLRRDVTILCLLTGETPGSGTTGACCWVSIETLCHTERYPEFTGAAAAWWTLNYRSAQQHLSWFATFPILSHKSHCSKLQM